MTTLVNVLVDDPRFNWNDISIELQKAISFYQNFGVDLVFLPRLREPFLGINLHFCQPNGSYAYPSQKKAKITLSDWFYRPNERWGVIAHELGHAIFNLPDHYEGASDQVPTSEPCIMNSPNETIFCSNCLEIINEYIQQQERRKNAIKAIALVGIPILVGFSLLALSSKKK